MTASAVWTPRPAPRTAPAFQTAVARYDADSGSAEYLPNVLLDTVSYREGAEPPTARFSYITDDRARAWGWPVEFEDVLRLAQKAPPKADERPEAGEAYVVKPGDRIVALGYGDGSDAPWILFDGFARSPSAAVSGRGQGIGFDAAGVAERLWDEPIHQVILRDAGKADSDEQADNRWAPVRARVNPDHRSAGLSIIVGNCTPDGSDLSPKGKAGDGSVGTPVFVDSTYLRKPDDAARPVPWTLDRLARYLMGAHNGDQAYVDNPVFEPLVALLKNRRPKEGSETYDPSKASTYDESPIVLPEMDLTGKPWPVVLNELLVHYGFAMCFRTESDGSGKPWNVLEVYRKDGSGPYPPKSIPYQQARETLDVNLTQVGSLSLARDFGAVFNGVIVDTQLTLYEVGVILLPAFIVTASDASSPQAFRLANLTNASPDQRNKYRLWVCEEVYGPVTTVFGGGYVVGGTTNDLVLDCFKIWPRGPEIDDAAIKETRRRRPGRDTLLSRDSNGAARRSFLSLSKDYAGPVNALWDGSGTWQDVAGRNGWELLKDRLGIRITIEDPEAWAIGQKTGSGGVNSPVKLVTATANPNAANPTLFMRLTTVIEGDRRVSKPLPRRASSPLKETRYRLIAARESFGQQAVHKSSPFYGDPATVGDDGVEADAVFVRNDAEAVEAYARSVQAASDVPPLAGTVTIPWITQAYRVADQISDIKGRDLSLQVNAATEQGEGRRYPYVVGLDWHFGGGGQSTVLHLSDRIAGPSEQGALA